MKTNIISEDKVKELIIKLLNEEKVSRQDYTKVLYKLDDLSNSLNETIKELRKTEDSLPIALRSGVGSKLSSIMKSLTSAQKVIFSIKEKVRQQKKAAFAQQTVEKKD